MEEHVIVKIVDIAMVTDVSSPTFFFIGVAGIPV